MTHEEMTAKIEGIKAEIDTAEDTAKVEELEKRAKTIKAEYDAEHAVVKRSAFNAKEAMKGEHRKMDNKNEVLEQREAFRAYMEKRADGQTKTSDIAIPETVQGMLKEKNVGKILAQTTQTAYPTGYTIALTDMDDEATWVAEGSGAETAKNGQVKLSFMAHKAQKRIAVTREVKAMSLPEFEATCATKAITAVTKAIETAVFTGEGTSSPKGITKDSAVETVDVKALDYATLNEFVGALSEEYDDNARLYMNKKTFMGILGMVDTTGQPVCRTSINIDGKPAHAVLGYDVVFTKALPSFASATEGQAVLVIGDMSKYCVNFPQGTAPVLEPYADHSVDGYVYEATALVDGKVAIPEAFVVAKKKVAK